MWRPLTGWSVPLALLAIVCVIPMELVIGHEIYVPPASIDSMNTDKCGKRLLGPPVDWPHRWGRISDWLDDEGSAQQDGGPLRPRISGGYEAYSGQFPWHIEIVARFPPEADPQGRGIEDSCGGVLIHNNLILTAAHCVCPRQKIEPTVSAYAHIIKVSTDPADARQKRWIPHWEKHPSFDCDDLPRGHDLAVLGTGSQRPFFYNEQVQPICLPFTPSNAPYQKVCTLAGLGTSPEYNPDPTPHIRWMKLKLNRPDFDDNTVIIAGSAYNLTYPGGACQGDSGSGVECDFKLPNGETRQVVSGILYRGGGKCEKLDIEKMLLANIHALKNDIISMAEKVLDKMHKGSIPIRSLRHPVDADTDTDEDISSDDYYSDTSSLDY